VLEIDPVDGAITWQYDAAGGPLFESVLRSNAQRLPNGNTLITESDGGRLIEVTPKDEIAWEYVNPVRAGTDERRIPIVTSGERFAADGVDGWLKPQ
jgi:hypothetical protein